MLTWFIKRKLAAFERATGYDASYMRHVLETDVSAFLAFSKVQALDWHKDLPDAVRHAVKITAVLHEDCGPCTQLCVGMALAARVSSTQIAAVVRGDRSTMIDDVKLGFDFATAVITRSAAAESHRDQIRAKWGDRAVISLAMALTAAQVYPTFKYALGYGLACTRIQVGDEAIAITHHGAGIAA